MKYRYELQSRIPNHEYFNEWRVIATSEHSAAKVLANFKTSRNGRAARDSIEGRKARGEELRIITVEVEERQVACEEL